MALFAAGELVDLVILVVALGYIFSGFVKRPRDPLDRLMARGLDWGDIWYAAAVVSPAVVLHELAHKGIGLLYGFESVLHISMFGLGIGVLLRFFHSPIIFFVPAFVASVGSVHPEQFAILALAGPATNFVLYWISEGLFISRQWPKLNHAFIISKQINLWLFILNMIPIGIFDGAKVLSGNPMLYFSFAAISGSLIYINEKRWKKLYRRRI